MKQRLAEVMYERGKAEIKLKWIGVVAQLKCLIRNSDNLVSS